MPWILLLIAGVFEIAWAISLKPTQGFTRLWPSIANILAAFASVYFLAQSMKTIPVGTAYAIWAGIGAVGAVTLGMIFFNESRDMLRLACIGLIIAGMVGLKLAEGQ